MERIIFLLCFICTSAIAAPLDVATSYFEAFARHDYITMGSLYKNQVETFHDPIFPKLSTRETKAMWQMLLSDSDLELKFEILSVEKDTVIAKWEGIYTYPDTGRQVHNIATTKFKIINDKIIDQQDDYKLCRWTAMALKKVQGKLACHLPGVLRSTAKKKLRQFMEIQKL